MALSDRNWYQVLEVPDTATAQEISSGYKKVALRIHPDKQPLNQTPERQKENLAAFHQLGEAYETLLDPKKKQLYDSKGKKSVVDPPSTPGDVQSANKTFARFMSSKSNRVVDQKAEIKELLKWWSQSNVCDLSPGRSLRVPDANEYELLIALYDQFRLTHSSITPNNKSTKVASEGRRSIYKKGT